MAWDSGLVAQAVRTQALSGAFASSFGSRLYVGEAAPRASLPYGVILIVDSRNDSTFEKDGTVIRLQVSLFGSEAGGPVIVGGYAASLRTNLSRSRPSVAGLTMLGVDYDIQRGPFRDGDLWRVDADYFARVLET